MKYQNYYIENSQGKSNCVIRSFCKLYNENYDNVFNELCSIAQMLGKTSFNDVEVFESYMRQKSTFEIEFKEDKQIKDLILDNGNYIIFCWDKKDFYHMVCVIEGVLFDKTDESMDLYIIKIYKDERCLSNNYSKENR